MLIRSPWNDCLREIFQTAYHLYYLKKRFINLEDHCLIKRKKTESVTQSSITPINFQWHLPGGQTCATYTNNLKSRAIQKCRTIFAIYELLCQPLSSLGNFYGLFRALYKNIQAVSLVFFHLFISKWKTGMKSCKSDRWHFCRNQEAMKMHRWCSCKQ